MVSGTNKVRVEDLGDEVKYGSQYVCDVLVIGSGAAGFATAIAARKAGLDVLLVEKAPVFGGTTATSVGYVWIPGNTLATRAGISDSLDNCRRYLKEELGTDYDEAKIEMYLKNGPKMIDFFVDEIGIPFVTTKMPDYHPDQPGALSSGRSLQVKPVKAAILGSELQRLRPLPRELSLFGMGISSGSDLSHFYKFGRSLRSQRDGGERTDVGFAPAQAQEIVGGSYLGQTSRVHKPSVLISFGLPDPLGFRAGEYAMVVADRGTDLDTEKYRWPRKT